MKEDYSTLVPKNRKNYSKSPKEISIYISDKIIAEQQKSIINLKDMVKAKNILK